MSIFTGKNLRQIRKSLGLSRKQVGDLLGVAAVTIEKWEQKNDTPIRSKYHGPLMLLSKAEVPSGDGNASGQVPSVSLSGFEALNNASLLTDSELENAMSTIEKLKRLTISERQRLLALVKKMNSPADRSVNYES